MAKKHRTGVISRGCFRVLRRIVWLVMPRFAMQDIERLDGEPCIIVGNHSHNYGPIVCELDLPGEHVTWAAGQMMHLKDVPAYAFQDFWSAKPKSVRWLFRIASYLIAPLSVCIFNNARTIGVYRDTRILNTFRQTVEVLQQGQHVVIFPEQHVPHNQIVHDFQTRFVDVAKMYHKRTGKAIRFVPAYIAPELRTMYFGEAVTFDPAAPIGDERVRICNEMMDRITAMAEALPRHRVVPYPNVPKEAYPYNKPVEEA